MKDGQCQDLMCEAGLLSKCKTCASPLTKNNECASCNVGYMLVNGECFEVSGSPTQSPARRKQANLDAMCGCVAKYDFCDKECSVFSSNVPADDAVCQNTYLDVVCTDGVPGSFFGTPYTQVCKTQCDALEAKKKNLETMCDCVAKYDFCDKECSAFSSSVPTDDKVCQNTYLDVVCVDGVEGSFFGTPYDQVCPKQCSAKKKEKNLEKMCDCVAKYAICDKECSEFSSSVRTDDAVCQSTYLDVVCTDGVPGSFFGTPYTQVCKKQCDAKKNNLETMCGCVAKYNFCDKECSEFSSSVPTDDAACQNAYLDVVCVDGADGSIFGTPYTQVCPQQCSSA